MIHFYKRNMNISQASQSTQVVREEREKRVVKVDMEVTEGTLDHKAENFLLVIAKTVKRHDNQILSGTRRSVRSMLILNGDGVRPLAGEKPIDVVKRYVAPLTDCSCNLEGREFERRRVCQERERRKGKKTQLHLWTVL